MGDNDKYKASCTEIVIVILTVLGGILFLISKVN